MDHVRKLKFSIYMYVHPPSISKMFQCHYASMIVCNVGEVSIFEDGHCISGLEHIRMLILSSYFLLACINTIYNYGEMYIKFQFLDSEEKIL